MFTVFVTSLNLGIGSATIVVNTVLVSPLVKPVVKIKLTVKRGSFRLLGHSLGDCLITAMFDIVASAVCFSLAPLSRMRSRLLTHASPAVCSILVTLYNNLTNVVTLSAGRGKGIVPKMTVTATLVPPLYATKFKLTAKGLLCFLNTFCLCFVGSMFVDLTAFVKIHIVRFRHGRFISGRHRGLMGGCVVFVALTAVYPTICLACNVMGDAVCRTSTGGFVGRRLGFGGARMVSQGVSFRGGRVHIILVNGRISRARVTATESGLGLFGLTKAGLIILRKVGGSTVSVNDVGTRIVRSFCGGDRGHLLRRRRGVGSLRGRLGMCTTCGAMSGGVVPRLGMLCPTTRTVTVTGAIRLRMSSARASALAVILVGFDGGPMKGRRRGVSG